MVFSFILLTWYINIIFNAEKFNVFSLKLGKKMSTLSILFNIALEIFAWAIRQKKELKAI
jgi:hypothetical protein